ncbi:MAG: DUF4197 domain-containing protein, partial [Gammaproteobacteria bacterium]|nr:DUF4197 domain-containing protein [Gammaproteobacteria bacterium]
MKHKLMLVVTTLAMTGQCNAGWLSDIVDSGKEKIDSVKEAVKENNNTISNVLSNEDITAGLKEALTKGAGYAVDHLGKADGFLKNADVKIPMPDNLNKVESILRKAGQDKYADEFITTMNRAAESAVPLTLDILKQGITGMSISDAKNILQGPDDAA